jgi:parallel beta-helix repeat protein
MKKRLYTFVSLIVLINSSFIGFVVNADILEVKLEKEDNRLIKNYIEHDKAIFVDDDADPSWYNSTNVKTIQEGVNNASIKGTVFVYSGTYIENIVIDKSINLIGENKDTTIIDGNYVTDVINILADHVNIANFSVKNSRQNKGAVFNLSSSNNTIKNIITLYDKVTLNNAAFMLNLGADNNTISDNILYNNDIGFYGESSGNILSNNTIRDCGLYSIYFFTLVENKDQICSHNTISNNTIFEIGDKIGWGRGLWLHASRYNIITGNSVKNKFSGISLSATSNNNFVSRNDFSYNRGYGIGVGPAIGCNISFNNVTNNEGFGIGFEFSPTHDNVVYHNNIINNKLNGYARECYNIQFIENYWDDWIGLRFPRLSFFPYWIPKGTRLNGRITIPRFSRSNFDWNPAKEPYDI